MRRVLVIGIGAGDPEQVTVQAIKALNETDVFFVIEGALLNLTPDGQVESVFDAPAMLEVYYALAEAAGMPRPSGVLVS